MAVVSEERGREAITHWRLLEKFGADRDKKRWPALSPASWRPAAHQIRVHMAHIGHPLLGDRVYGGGFKGETQQLPEAAQLTLKALNRQALHARALGFAHPVTREDLMFESELPEGFFPAGRGVTQQG